MLTKKHMIIKLRCGQTFCLTILTKHQFDDSFKWIYVVDASTKILYKRQ